MPVEDDTNINEEGRFESLIQAARSGSSEAAGELMESCRAYLLLVANQDLDQKLRGKVGASDLVQEALLSAQHSINHFKGATRNEFLAWLCGILSNDLLESHRRFRGTAKRQIDREVALGGDSRPGVSPSGITEQRPTPGSEAIANEEATALREAMNRLPADYQNVLELRNWQQLSFADVGQRTGRSADAARKLWTRAVLALQQELNTNVGAERPTE